MLKEFVARKRKEKKKTGLLEVSPAGAIRGQHRSGEVNGGQKARE